MKKLSVILFVLIVLSASCKGQANWILEERFRTEDFLPEVDMQLEYAVSKGSLCRFNSVYYFHSDVNFIYYYDETSGLSGKLCAKADCTHDSADCNAYLASISGLQIYDGKLYFIEDASTLYCMDLTGNNRVSVMFLRNLQGTNPKFAIHRGYVYTSVSDDQIQDGGQKTRFTLSQQVLGQTDTAKTIIDETFEAMSVEAWILCGNHLYAALDAVQQSGSLNRLYDYDIQTGELNSLWNEKSNYGTLDLRINDSHTDLEMIQKTLTGSIRVIEFDLNLKTRREMLLFSEERAIPFANFVENKIIGFHNGGKRGLLPYQIFDRAGEVMAEGVFPEQPGGSSYTMMTGCGSDENGIYMAMHNMDIGEERLLRIPYDSDKLDTLIACSRN